MRFGSVKAGDQVSFEIRPGEVVGLIGPNGAGKTTIVDAITGYSAAHSGQVLLNGRVMSPAPASVEGSP